MRPKWPVFVLLFCSVGRLHAMPQPYAWEIVYRSASPRGSNSASDLRKHSASATEINIDFLGFLDTIRWGDSHCDPAIKRKAGPLETIVDCYRRVQPEPPLKPNFDTLYISRNYIYSDEGNFVKITPRIRRFLTSALIP